MSPLKLQELSTGSTDGDSQLDRIIDDFEHRWLKGDSPDIEATCREYSQKAGESPRKSSVADCALQLAIVDLELRWRIASPEARRGTDWYRQHLTIYGLDEAKLRLLAFNELEVRSRWGDSPRFEQLVSEQFPSAGEANRCEIARLFCSEIELRFPIVCNVSSEATHRFRTILQTPCVVGRQRSSDPAIHDLRYCPREQMMRLVIADRTENFISRVQVKLERISVNELCVTPMSESVPCFLGSRRLADKSEHTLAVSPGGIMLAFGGFLMHFKRL